MKDEAKKRKDTPIYSGVLKYFPDAVAAVSRVSKVGNDQHNPGRELFWDRSKSSDEYDACARHLVDRAAGEELDTDGQRHMAKVAWRALAALQKEIEAEQLTADEQEPEPPFVEFKGRLENSKSQKIAMAERCLELEESCPGYLTASEKAEYIKRLNTGAEDL
jgi:hypothetical protein